MNKVNKERAVIITPLLATHTFKCWSNKLTENLVFLLVDFIKFSGFFYACYHGHIEVEFD